jgi:TatD DNase family protein
MTPPKLIDSHAHLDFEQFDKDRDRVLQNAREAGVSEIVTIGTDVATSRAARALVNAPEDTPRLFATAGVHPHEAAKVEPTDWEAFETLWRDEGIVAVGEIGLDYYYDFSPRERQLAVFEKQLVAARERELPVVIHIRDAFDDFFERFSPLPAGGVLHCFTGGPKEAEKALALGLMVSFSGIATFPKAQNIRDAAKIVPLDRLLVETDAPYLAPKPHRGKRNEPAYVVHTARCIAEARGISYETLCEATRRNTIALFRLPVGA